MNEEVKIPFLPEFEGVMESGQKTLTSRTKWHGREGDYFRAFGHYFVITHLSKKKLSTVARLYHQQEGCSSPEDFIRVWCKIHPRAGWRPDQVVKCHEFVNQRELAKFHIHEMDGGRCHICGFEAAPERLEAQCNT